ncbi:MAG: hypothetical protein M3Q08_18405 [Pseudomonadota bacterium]|nr:hypothetical protein [Pseudomonadota bacterium]
MSNTKKITRKAIQLPALLDDCQVPLPGYEAITLKIRLNPPQSTLRDDLPRGGGSISHEEQAALDNLRSLIENPEATPDTRAEAEKTIAEHAAIVADRTARLGRALQVLFGATPVMEIETADGVLLLDFSTPAAALATFEHPLMPDDMAAWLLKVPYHTAKRRYELLDTELPNSFARKS